ncbi:MAG: hypothetical protein BWY64_00371 [bacterium ADurb.Bin363]|nr:MAG: hypothetical protein BWY64_00371 [bacterium ADurb.Bin363]
MSAFKENCQKVEKFLMEGFKYSCRKRDINFFTIKKGSTIVHVFIQDYDEKDSLVCCRAYVVYGAELSYKLLKQLLLMNSEDLRFGKFGIDKNGYIILDQVMLGNTLDREELMSTVKEICMVADELDNELINQYGGKTALECFIEENKQ